MDVPTLDISYKRNHSNVWGPLCRASFIQHSLEVHPCCKYVAILHSLFFKTTVLGSQQNWGEGTEISHISPAPRHAPGLSQYHHPPPAWNIHFNWWTYIDNQASLIAQLVKNPPVMQETPFQFLGWEDPLEKGTATHSSILAWRIHGLYSPWGRK